MTRTAPHQEWWTTDALAASGLPDVPATRQGVDALAARQGWRAQPMLARRRSGRGGGWEYSWRLLPVRAQAALLKSVETEDEAPSRMGRDEAWAWFDGLPEKAKTAARDRLAILQQVEGLEAPMGKNLAVETVARGADIAPRTIWNWVGMIEGVDPADRLPYLAPRHRAAAPKRERAECSPEFLDRIRADYLRLGGPSLRSAHRRVADWCQRAGLAFLEYRTTLRWFEENVPRVTQVFAREGEKGLARCFPPQIRDRSTLSALEGVVADCHKVDVFVQWPDIADPVRVQTRNVFRGNHAIGTIYATGDQVIYGGSGWTARVHHLASGGNVPPTLPMDQNTWWTLAAVQGQPGANGAQGERGTKQVAVATAGTVWSDSEANAALSAAGWGAPIQGDVVTLYNSTAAFSQTRVRSGGVWSPLAAFFGGDVLVDGTVEGRHLKVGTITTDKITIGGTNLIANADFATGDFTNWVKADNPLGSSVVARTTSGVPAGAPTAYVARFLPSGTGTISLFAAARAYNMPGAAQDGFPVSAGEIYSISVEAAKAAAFAATGLQLRVYFILNDGTYTTNIVPLGFLTAVTTSWASYSASFTVPANAVRGFGFISVYGLTAGALYWTNLRIQKKVSAAGIVDGSVGPTQLDQAALAVAGLAVFGGTLQSTDYAPGVSGWALDNAGDAELNSLVVRTDMIVVGATEARLDHFSSSTFDIASGAVPNNVVVLLDVPATCVSTATVPAIVEFEARFRNDVEAKTRLAFRLTALTGPSDHPETGDWTNLGVEYVYLHPASQQLIDYKKCIWFLNDFDLTTATKLRLRVEYFTSGGVWTGTDTAMENRIFSLRQSKRV